MNFTPTDSNTAWMWYNCHQTQSVLDQSLWCERSAVGCFVPPAQAFQWQASSSAVCSTVSHHYNVEEDIEDPLMDNPIRPVTEDLDLGLTMMNDIKQPSSQVQPCPDTLVSLMQAAKATKVPSATVFSDSGSEPAKTLTSGKRKRRPNPPKKATPLPEDFEPSEYSVLCGQGSENYNATGNRRFRITAAMFVEKYIDAKDRHEKSEIVREVLKIIQAACPVGSFVTQKNGRWYSVDERSAREKIGAYFRDCLAGHYKSSAKSKIARRKSQQSRRSSSSSASQSSSICSASESSTYLSSF